MLAHGRKKVAAAGFPAESVRLVQGDAQDLSSTLAASARFDAATMAFAIRNVPDRLKALKSIAGHLKPGARLAILGALPRARVEEKGGGGGRKRRRRRRRFMDRRRGRGRWWCACAQGLP